MSKYLFFVVIAYFNLLHSMAPTADKESIQLWRLCHHTNPDIPQIKKLIEQGIKTNFTHLLFTLIKKNGNEKLIELIAPHAKKGCDSEGSFYSEALPSNYYQITFERLTPIHAAVKHDRLHLLPILKQYFDINEYVDQESEMMQQPPLLYALSCNKTKAAQALLHHGADPNSFYYSYLDLEFIFPLDYALEKNNTELAQELFEHGADPLVQVQVQGTNLKAFKAATVQLFPEYKQFIACHRDKYIQEMQKQIEWSNYVDFEEREMINETKKWKLFKRNNPDIFE